MSPLEGIVRVGADSDLDGLMAAAVLKASKPEIEVHFAHPALLRSGNPVSYTHLTLPTTD